MEEQQRQQIKKYVDIVVRRKKLIITFCLLSIIAGLAVYLKTDKVYQSTALIIYQRARINPASEMSPDVQTQTREMVATLTQQVTSRSSLEALIKQFDLYPELRQQLPMEDVVDRMRTKAVSIKQERGDVFKVSFSGARPKKVMQVANALAARFIEENLRYREEKATETSAYVKDELNISKEGLDKKERAMRDFKLKYYNEMPQQLEVNMSRLTALQEQLQRNRDSAQDLERTKVLIQEQITLRKDALAQMAAQARQMGLLGGEQGGINGQQVEENPALAQSLEKLAALRTALDELKTRYTDKHPEVKRLQKQLKKQEEEHAALVREMAPEESEEKGPGVKEKNTGKGRSDRFHDTQLRELELQMKKVDFSITRLAQERENLKAQVKQYEKWIEMTPVREAEWSALTRDYKQLYDHYQRLVVRNLEAESVESLERRQKGSQFKIVDSAYFPEKPVKPDFVKTMLLSLGLGLALGGGLAFLLELRDSSFRDAADLESYLGLPVVCVLPVIRTQAEAKGEKLRFAAWVSALLVSVVVLVGAVIYLYKAGRIII